MAIKHATQTAQADDPAYDVSAGEWNEAHTIENDSILAAHIKDGDIANTHINAAAAIAYTKLNLTGAILNADINAAAAIVYSKLNLTGSILNADVNAAAAIVYSKLSLANSIVNADINAAAAIAYSKLSLTNSILTGDIKDGEIVNADIDATAAIALSKMALDLTTHASRHQSAGADAIKLDDFATPDDNTDLNASTTRHGLLPKLNNVVTDFLNGQGGWSAPAGAHTHYDRMIWNALGYISSTNQIITVGRVYLLPIQIKFTLTVDDLGVVYGPNTAGNVRVGIYADNGDTPVGGALLRESASTAVVAGNQKHEVALTSTYQLSPGLYWLAFQGDDAVTQFKAQLSTHCTGGTLYSHRYDRGGGYGAFTNPCPATVALSTVPALYAMVTSVP